MTQLDRQFRALIGAFLEQTGTSARRFGVEAFLHAPGIKGYVFGELAVGDPSFVDRLRRGASFRLSTVARARSWMAGQACVAARAAMRRAVAGAPLLGDAPKGNLLRHATTKTH